MQCQACKKAPATVTLTEVVSNAKREIHLCEACALQREGVLKASSGGGLGVPELVMKALEALTGAASDPNTARCSGCDFTIQDFRTTGKLGCRRCFSTFEREISSLLGRIHGTTGHRGKSPARAAGRGAPPDEIEQLRRQLVEAVAAEAYEQAAAIRNRLRRLEGAP